MSYYNNQDTNLKWRPRLKFYSNPSKTCTYNPETEEALSYKWWIFVKRINGKLVFNDYNYSVTTTNHQREVKALLKKLRIKIDITVKIHDSLSYAAISSHIPNLYCTMFENEIEANRKTSKGWIHEARLSIAKSSKKSIDFLRIVGYKITKKQINKIKKATEARERERIVSMKLNKRIGVERRKQQKIVTEVNTTFNPNIFKRSA